jgi:hypothetical protein
MDRAIKRLEEGPLYLFRDWPNAEVPQVAAGVYTIWRNTKLIYVGMSGRGLTREQIAVHRADADRKGLYSRLASHAAGRRSGDQFCVYVADRLVLPMLSSEQVNAVGAGRESMDALVRVFIHKYLSYRFVEVSDGAEAGRVEREIRDGALNAGKPLLNPGKQQKTRSAGSSQ